MTRDMTGVNVRPLRTPPMLRGAPFIGSLPDFLRNHVAVFHRGYEQHGRVFAIRLGPQRGVVLVGPEYHEFYFREVDRRLSVPELYEFVIPMFGEVVLAVRDPGKRRAHVALLQSAFQGRRLARYTETMAEETYGWLDTLGDSGTFDLWAAFERLSIDIAAGALLGPELRTRAAQFRPLLGDLARGMEFVLPPNLPLPKFRRRDRARGLLTEMIRPVLAERRARPGAHADFLQTLADHPDLDAAGTADEELVGMSLVTLFTGYITTAAQMAWALVLLLQNPGYLKSVTDELDRERAGPPDGDLSDLPFPVRSRRLEWALKEAVRLRPVMSHYARTNAEEYELDGYRIPQGWLTMLCPSVAHRLPDVFADPDRYDPERFGPERAEDKRHPHALIGFGGGFYRCPGSAFGMQEMATVLGLLLTRYSVELTPADPAADFDMGVIRPRSSATVHYRRRRR